MTVKCDNEDCQDNASEALTVYDLGYDIDSKIVFLCKSHVQGVRQKINAKTQGIISRTLTGNSNSEYSLDKNSKFKLSIHDTERIENRFKNALSKMPIVVKAYMSFYRLEANLTIVYAGKDISQAFNATHPALDNIEEDFPDIYFEQRYYNPDEFEKYYDYNEKLIFER